jgi:hypothetical protein
MSPAHKREREYKDNRDGQSGPYICENTRSTGTREDCMGVQPTGKSTGDRE